MQRLIQIVSGRNPSAQRQNSIHNKDLAVHQRGTRVWLLSGKFSRTARERSIGAQKKIWVLRAESTVWNSGMSYRSHFSGNCAGNATSIRPHSPGLTASMAEKSG